MKMKRLLLLLSALSLVLPANGQISSNTARHIIASTSLPSTCSPNTGDVYVLVSAGPTGTPYYCDTPNHWTVWTGGGGSSVSLTGGTGISVSPNPITGTGVITNTSPGASPAGSTTEVQYRLDATHFGATPMTYDATNLALDFEPGLAAQDFLRTFVVVGSDNPPNPNTGVMIGGYFEMDARNTQNQTQAVGLHMEADALSTGNLVELGGMQSYAFNSGSGTITNQYGTYLFVEDTSAATVTNLYGDWIAFYGADGGGNITNLAGVWVDPATVGMGSTVTNLYGFHMATPTVVGTVTNSFGVWISDFSAIATNPYYSWFDSGGVRRVKEDATFNSVGQAIEALYNPQFTKYTPGAANYERIVQQWESNVAVLTTEKGGTGTLRDMQLGDAGVHILVSDLKTTGAATGKKTVCVDTTTGRLYASSTGTDCSN